MPVDPEKWTVTEAWRTREPLMGYEWIPTEAILRVEIRYMGPSLCKALVCYWKLRLRGKQPDKLKRQVRLLRKL